MLAAAVHSLAVIIELNWAGQNYNFEAMQEKG